MLQTCPICQSPIIQPKTGRPRIYCSDACRLVAFRAAPVAPNGTDPRPRRAIIKSYRAALAACPEDATKHLARRNETPGTTQRNQSGPRNETSRAHATKPVALDLYCGGGGAGFGLFLAGFNVIGIDNVPRPEYPFTFIQGDALNPPVDLSLFDLIWASPVCHQYSTCNNWLKRDYPKQIGPTREILQASCKPYIMENVPGAPLHNPVVLTGSMFGLSLIRRRHFETSFPCMAPLRTQDRGRVKNGDAFTVAGGGNIEKGNMRQWRKAMDIDWLKRETLTQAIPPAYSWYLALQACEKML